MAIEIFKCEKCGTVNLARFLCNCPFRVGDRVYTVGERMANANLIEDSEKFKTITGIGFVHHGKSGAISFLYELDYSGTYQRYFVDKIL